MSVVEEVETKSFTQENTILETVSTKDSKEDLADSCKKWDEEDKNQIRRHNREVDEQDVPTMLVMTKAAISGIIDHLNMEIESISSHDLSNIENPSKMVATQYRLTLIVPQLRDCINTLDKILEYSENCTSGENMELNKSNRRIQSLFKLTRLTSMLKPSKSKRQSHSLMTLPKHLKLPDSKNNEYVQMDDESQLHKEDHCSDVVDESSGKFRHLNEMTEGSWFFKVEQKYGTIGKALGAFVSKKVFIRVSEDYQYLYGVDNESFKLTESCLKTYVSGNAKNNRRQICFLICLKDVTGCAYGFNSKAYRVQSSRGVCHSPELCFSLWTSQMSIDLVALDEKNVECWYHGIKTLIPCCRGRFDLTPAEFKKQKKMISQNCSKKTTYLIKSTMSQASYYDEYDATSPSPSSCKDSPVWSLVGNTSL